MAIESLGLVILSIDRNGEDGKFGSFCSHHRVPKQRGAKLAPAMRLIDREPAKARDRHRRIAR